MTTKKKEAPPVEVTEKQVVAPATEASVTVRTPEVIAAEIRFIDNQARQYVLHSAIDIGQKLLEVKELVGHGEWGKWLKDNVNYSQSTANNFMAVSREYSQSQSLANLSYSQAVALLSVPADERESFAEDVGAADMSTRELQAAIKAKEEAERQLVETQQKVAQQKEQFDKWAAQQTEKTSELEERHRLSAELREAAEKQVEELNAELEKAKAGGDTKEIAKAKTELRKAEKAKQTEEKKSADLQKQLDNLKAAVEKETADRMAQLEHELKAQSEKELQAVKEQADQDKQSMQDRLNTLEQQLARSNNEAFLRAKLQLSQLVTMGDTLVKAIAEVKETEEQSKLKVAAVKVIDQLRSLF